MNITKIFLTLCVFPLAYIAGVAEATPLPYPKILPQSEEVKIPLGNGVVMVKKIKRNGTEIELIHAKF